MNGTRAGAIEGNVVSILSTPNQIAMERRAAKIFGSATLQRALLGLDDITSRSSQSGLPAGRATAGRAMQELAFAYVLRNLNADSSRPQILWDQNPPRFRDGVRIPGSRCTGNNPDNIYRRLPVDPSSCYRLSGCRNHPAAADVTISVLPSVAVQESWRQTLISADDIVMDADGRFTLTMDASPAAGRANHLQLAPGAARITIRESMIDWSRENPYRFEVDRLDGPASPAGADDDTVASALAGRLPAFAKHWIDFCNRTYFSPAPNCLPQPTPTPGGMITQISAMGHFDLEDDEALVIRADPLGAKYCGFQLMDPWMFGLEYRYQTGSLNHGQAVPDLDGRITYVVSAHDPEVHNWLDTDALLQGAMQIRWQGLPNNVVWPSHPVVTARRMPLVELARLDLAPVTPLMRRQQIDHRLASHDRRLTA
jgi:hypothetical protein